MEAKVFTRLQPAKRVIHAVDSAEVLFIDIVDNVAAVSYRPSLLVGEYQRLTGLHPLCLARLRDLIDLALAEHTKH